MSAIGAFCKFRNLCILFLKYKLHEYAELFSKPFKRQVGHCMFQRGYEQT